MKLICQILKASAFCEAKAGQGHTADHFHLPPSRQNFFGHFCATSTRISNLSGSGRKHVQAKMCDINEDSALLVSMPLLGRQSTRAKVCDINERNQPFLVLAAHVGSWKPSWPQDCLQDLQHGPSKTPGALIASQHGLPNTNSDPKMAPETPGMACFAPKIASELPLQGKPIDKKTCKNQSENNRFDQISVSGRSCWLLAALLATRWPPRSATWPFQGPRCPS